MLATAFIFIALIALLVLVHEAGHFFAAKKAGIKVEEFGFGFPPRIMGFQTWKERRVVGETVVREASEEVVSVSLSGGEGAVMGEEKERLERTVETADLRRWRAVWGSAEPANADATVYSLNWIPLGGFVKIFGEEGEGEGDHASFVSRPALTRFIIIAAGVCMNVLLAMAFFSVGHMVGLPAVIGDGTAPKELSSVEIQVIEVAKDSPVEKAGLAIGDVITGIDGVQFADVDGIQSYVNAHKGTEVAMEIVHDASPKTLVLIPRENPPQGEGPLGFAMVKTGIEKLPWYSAIARGVSDTFLAAWLILKAIGTIFADIFTKGSVPGDVAGPVGIAVLTGRVAKLGLAHLLQFAGMISVNLALLNVFPIPALDGGRLLFIVLEKIKGKPIPRMAEQRIHQVGFILLLALMLLITVRDVVRLF